MIYEIPKTYTIHLFFVLKIQFVQATIVHLEQPNYSEEMSIELSFLNEEKQWLGLRDVEENFTSKQKFLDDFTGAEADV